jgi:uncharacterized protein (DUF952 family)
MSQTIYKILDAAEWAAAQAQGRYDGSEVDRRDGFIHFSTAEQVEETARRHFAGRSNLVLVAVNAAQLKELKWEPSRGGELFPHLYAPLPASAVRWTKPIDRDGERHLLPGLDV